MSDSAAVDIRNFDDALAEMWNGDRREGFLHVYMVELASRSRLARFIDRHFRAAYPDYGVSAWWDVSLVYPARSEWGGFTFGHDRWEREQENARFAAELASSFLTFRAVRYDLRWIHDEEEKRGILSAEF